MQQSEFYKNLVFLLRPEQWVKNLFVVFPVFFNGQLLNISALSSCATAFIAFSLAASSVYCFNDLCDVNADKRHPEKKQRPFASGAVSATTVSVVMASCFVLSMLLLGVFGGKTRYFLMLLTTLYCLMNIAYSLWLKQYAIIDTIIIAVGFVLRVVIGGTATGIWLSEWIIVMTFLLSLFLAFAKRRDDVVVFENTGVSPREKTDSYNLDFINQTMTVLATVTIVAYLIYTLSPDVMARFHCRYLYLTTVFVLAGIIRYLQIAIVDLNSGNPTKVLWRDRFIQTCVLAWIISFLVLIYGSRFIAG